MTGSSSSGPLPQLPPIASAPAGRECRDRSLGRDAHHRVAPGVEGHRGHDRDPLGCPPDAGDRRLDLGEVRHRLDPDHVDAAGDERGCLLGEDVDRLGLVERPERRHDLAGRSDVARHERPPAGRVHLGAQEDRRGPVQLGDPRVEPVEPEPEPVAAERVRHDDPRPRLEVTAVDAADHVGVGDVPGLGRVAELESRGEEHRAHRAVCEDRAALRQQLPPATVLGTLDGRRPDGSGACGSGRRRVRCCGSPRPASRRPGCSFHEQ